MRASSQSPLASVSALRRKLRPLPCSSFPAKEVIPTAIYHYNIGIVCREKGKSAVAAAAYRSGEKITNEWDGMTHDYTRKRGVVHTEILLPPHAPPAFSDRATLSAKRLLYHFCATARHSGQHHPGNRLLMRNDTIPLRFMV